MGSPYQEGGGLFWPVVFAVLEGAFSLLLGVRFAQVNRGGAHIRTLFALRGRVVGSVFCQISYAHQFRWRTKNNAMFLPTPGVQKKFQRLGVRCFISASRLDRE